MPLSALLVCFSSVFNPPTLTHHGRRRRVCETSPSFGLSLAPRQKIIARNFPRPVLRSPSAEIRVAARSLSPNPPKGIGAVFALLRRDACCRVLVREGAF